MTMLLRSIPITSAVILVLSTMIIMVQAGYEHTCPYDKLSPRQSRQMYRCGIFLTRFIASRCDQSAEERQTGGIFLDTNEANSVLSRRKQPKDVGLVCECCIHSCTVTELSEYCPTNSRRRRRDTSGSQSSVRQPHFSQHDVDEFYQHLKMDLRSSKSSAYSSELIEKMQELENQKVENTQEAQQLSSTHAVAEKLQVATPPDFPPKQLLKYMLAERATNKHQQKHHGHHHRHHHNHRKYPNISAKLWSETEKKRD